MGQGGHLTQIRPARVSPVDHLKWEDETETDTEIELKTEMIEMEIEMIDD